MTLLMKRFVVGLGLASVFLPTTAWADDEGSFVGVGSTVTLTALEGGPVSFSAPSLDVRLGSIFVQVHLFETLSVLSLGGDSFYAGGNVFALPLSKSLGRKGSWEIFAGVGASFDFSTVDEFIAWGPIAPIGVRVGRRGARAALYVTPGFDMVLFPGSSLNVAVADPRLMASVWF